MRRCRCRRRRERGGGGCVGGKRGLCGGRRRRLAVHDDDERRPGLVQRLPRAELQGVVSAPKVYGDRGGLHLLGNYPYSAIRMNYEMVLVCSGGNWPRSSNTICQCMIVSNLTVYVTEESANFTPSSGSGITLHCHQKTSLFLTQLLNLVNNPDAQVQAALCEEQRPLRVRDQLHHEGRRRQQEGLHRPPPERRPSQHQQRRRSEGGRQAAKKWWHNAR